MRLRNILKTCLVFWKSEPQYAYKRYAYKKNMYARRVCPPSVKGVRFRVRFNYKCYSFDYAKAETRG